MPSPHARNPAPTGETVIVVPTESARLRHRPGAILAVLVVLALLVAGGIYGAYHYKKGQEQRAAAIQLTGGNPDLGAALITQYGCGGCHTIPGVPRAAGRVGPPLQDIARRVYIAGVLTNTPDNLIQWIVDPRSVNPKTAMPVTGISSEEARQVAAYLYSLQ
ncbi:c-type cytochrome [Microvirga massiliensis]|uniref:c-type cytochrome n=1 Tax=Microvirga massiliensis TaxID=1033741 RepID=UPI001FCD32FA|nr:c-type cytochrome [Microvirga massiliensis]